MTYNVFGGTLSLTQSIKHQYNTRSSVNEAINKMMLTGQLTEERQCSLIMSTCPITATFNMRFNTRWAQPFSEGKGVVSLTFGHGWTCGLCPRVVTFLRMKRFTLCCVFVSLHYSSLLWACRYLVARGVTRTASAIVFHRVCNVWPLSYSVCSCHLL